MLIFCIYFQDDNKTYKRVIHLKKVIYFVRTKKSANFARYKTQVAEMASCVSNKKWNK